MRIPNFVPLVESERRKRELMGLFIEMMMGGYVAVVLCRIVFASIIYPRIENLAYDEPIQPWAVNFVKMVGLDSRYLSFEWSTLGLIFLVGAVLGFLIGLTGKGVGPWISSLSRLQVNNPEDSLRVRKHWSYARKEGSFILFCTIVTGWIITKIDLGKVFDGEGVSAAGRLTRPV